MHIYYLSVGCPFWLFFRSLTHSLHYLSLGGWCACVRIRKRNAGWLNSIAGLMKRRLQSYTKHSGGGNKNNNNNNGLGTSSVIASGEPIKFSTTNPFLGDVVDDVARLSLTACGRDSTTTTQTRRPSLIPHHSKFNDGGGLAADARHRSPDPPPRYNRGQSPLLLRKNLLELERSTGSPMLPRR